MANREHLAILKQGVEVWNECRRSAKRDFSMASLIAPDLSGADLSGVYLSKADLNVTYLNGANLNKADLSNADLSLADLSNADLSNANLGWADLRKAKLGEANLRAAYLVGANLSGTNLCNAVLNEARLFETLLADVNLRSVHGLGSCRHDGPSTIDHRTLAKSGPLPLAFLRGCGLPDNFIEYLPSLFNQPIELYSCFISYSTKDQEFADRLHADLQAKGVRCWFAPHHVAGGKKLHEQIDEAIRIYDRLLLVLSEHSMSSEWVKTEIAHARQKELNRAHQVLFPISVVPFSEIRAWNCFDADTGKDSAREIREYFIPNFSQWKNHYLYHRAFERLLRDLKTDVGDRTGETSSRS